MELLNHIPTGKHYHQFINPERSVPEEALRVHGLSEEFLSKHPKMADVVDDFLLFIGESKLIIHNAEFDLGFINVELERLGRQTIPLSRSLDTVKLARKMFPGASVSLDALCKKFQIDNSSRTLHGALLDAELLAEVYLELIGGSQADLNLLSNEKGSLINKKGNVYRKPRRFSVSKAELMAHSTFLEKIKKPIWKA